MKPRITRAGIENIHYPKC